MDYTLPTHPASYIERKRTSPEERAKIDVAAYVAANLVAANDRVFVASGTTAAIAGLEILCRKPEVKMQTHSVPMAWHFMEFMHRKLLGVSASVEILSGAVDPTTGIIKNAKIGKISSSTFLYAPHGIDKAGVTGNRDIVYLQAAWQAHPKVILMATTQKFLDRGSHTIKYLGHIKKESLSKKRKVDMVIPEDVLESAHNKDGKISEVIDAFKLAGVIVHLAPRCESSPWFDYSLELKQASDLPSSVQQISAES